ncbi:uncharacterized protein MONBRDRAFT_30384 [Monosiga brevicollis MX1]|uniref:EamA domain-containing protein n=1 Tax=Monosiga brevicollis TaxID=81824 RepID=A9VDT7_MONBE|nr:uncharacterized protein MONBRDRAFT_30384 [Monosiga brevicollis MX1]EDQ84305.1 predicted protein [Monosiga brevicollis MX1]|eukprot:XP_001750875.1 hypothetical protein [Monosiga brevicollis MX1]
MTRSRHGSSSTANGSGEAPAKPKPWLWIISYMFFAAQLIAGVVSGMDSILLHVNDRGDWQPPTALYLFVFMVGEMMILLPCALLLRSRGRGGFKAPAVRTGFMAGALNGIGVLGFVALNGIEEGEASSIAPFSSLYVLIPILYGLIVRREKLTAQKAIGVTVGVLSTVSFIYSGSIPLGVNRPDIVLAAMACFVGWGGCIPFYHHMSTWPESSFAAAYIVNILTFGMVGLVPTLFTAPMLPDVRELGMLEIFNRSRNLLGAGACDGLSSLAFIAMSAAYPEDSVVVGTLSSLYVIFPTVVGLLWLGESRTTGKIVAVALGLLSSGLLSAEA